VSDPGTSLDPRPSGNGHPELLEQLERQEEEILRLRDLLIGKDAELGLARGRLAELEEQIARYTRLADRLRLRRILFAIARRLRILNPNG
jgi:hypothetical protein